MVLLALCGLLICAVVVMTVVVEREAEYILQSLSDGQPRALILYHPSRDAHFSDDLSVAIADGLKSKGYGVDRATLTQTTPTEPEGYQLIVVLSNTFYWTPDLPTLRYLRRAKFIRLPVIGVIAGAGATDRSQRMLHQSLKDSGANILAMRAYWTSKPNGAPGPTKTNRELAMQLARQLGAEVAKQGPPCATEKS